MAAKPGASRPNTLRRLIVAGDLARALVGTGVAVLVLAALACGGRAGAETDGSVEALLSEFKIDIDAGLTTAGSVRFTVKNHGQSTHNMHVVRADLASGDLPTHDGRVSVPHSQHLVHVSDVKPGRQAVSRGTLTPGRYVLYCDIAGHYAAGMHAELVVEP